MKIVEGNLITMMLHHEFDVIAHGCNCYCKQTAGIAKDMVEWFGTDKFPMEDIRYIAHHNKLGTIDYRVIPQPALDGTRQIHEMNIVNCYTQYRYGRNHADGDNDPYNKFAIALCLQKLNHEFKGKRIGLPYLGCGLASPPNMRHRRKELFESMVELLMPDCDVTIVEYDGTKVKNYEI